MIFNIFHDSGGSIGGTVIPDTYSEVSRIRLIAGGREIAVFPTNELNQDVLAYGQHETGLVNFTITEQSHPGLSGWTDLELHEVDTGLLLYRRRRPEMIKGKFLRLETQLLPLWRFDEAVKHRFQQYYKRSETLGLSGTRQLFLLYQDSIYVSGRILIRNFMHAVDSGFKLIALIRDPYEELAERLLIMNKADSSSMNALGEREAIVLREAIDYTSSLSLDDDKALVRGLRRMPKEVGAALANPVVRQFSTKALDEQPSQGGVAMALDILAESVLVGLRSEPHQFSAAFGEMIGEDLSNPALFPRFAKVTELAEIVRSAGVCEVILEKDLELYHHVLESHQKAAHRVARNDSSVVDR